MENNNSIDGLVDRLNEMQRIMGWSHPLMAEELGISYGYWMMIRNGDRQPGRKFLIGVLRCFPQLEAEAIEFLRQFS